MSSGVGPVPDAGVGDDGEDVDEVGGVRGTSLSAEDPRQVDGYRLVSRLGQGGQATVYLARDPHGDLVALKVLLPQTLAEPGARARIADEIMLARRVPSFCTARLLGARLDGPMPYLVNEYVAGPSLGRAVRRHGPLAGSDLERLIVGTLTALVTIHRAGVVHRDLKPENILLGPDGPRVVDFGIALRAGALDPQADEDGVLGSAAFLAPERLDAGPATPASDVFGWAATMAFAAVGRSPFQGATQTATVRAIEHDAPRLTGVPSLVLPLLLDCLHKDPRRRPTASQALARFLEAVQPIPTPSQVTLPQTTIAATGRVAATRAPDSATAAADPAAGRVVRWSRCGHRHPAVAPRPVGRRRSPGVAGGRAGDLAPMLHGGR